MKATFNLPEDLYREVKARSALEGRTVKDVVIQLFEEWLGRESAKPRPTADWTSFKPPLVHLVKDGSRNASMAEIRKSIAKGFDESA